MDQDSVKVEDVNSDSETEDWILVADEPEESELDASFVDLQAESESTKIEPKESHSQSEKNELQDILKPSQSIVTDTPSPIVTITESSSPIVTITDTSPPIVTIPETSTQLPVKTIIQPKSKPCSEIVISKVQKQQGSSVTKPLSSTKSLSYAEVLQKANGANPTWTGRAKKKKKGRFPPRHESEKKTQRRGSCAQQYQDSAIVSGTITLCV